MSTSTDPIRRRTPAVTGDPFTHPRLRPSARTSRRRIRLAVLGLESQIVEQAGHLFHIPNPHHPLHQRPSPAAAHDSRGGATAQQKLHGVHYDRLPGPGLPRHNIQSRSERCGQVPDYREVPNPELSQHDCGIWGRRTGADMDEWGVNPRRGAWRPSSASSATWRRTSVRAAAPGESSRCPSAPRRVRGAPRVRPPARPRSGTWVRGGRVR